MLRLQSPRSPIHEIPGSQQRRVRRGSPLPCLRTLLRPTHWQQRLPLGARGVAFDLALTHRQRQVLLGVAFVVLVLALAHWRLPQLLGWYSTRNLWQVVS